MCGSKPSAAGAAAEINSRYFPASSAVRTGGVRFGITNARLNVLDVNGTTSGTLLASRTCRCQSSGRVKVSDDADAEALLNAALLRLGPSRSRSLITLHIQLIRHALVRLTKARASSTSAPTTTATPRGVGGARAGAARACEAEAAAAKQQHTHRRGARDAKPPKRHPIDIAMRVGRKRCAVLRRPLA